LLGDVCAAVVLNYSALSTAQLEYVDTVDSPTTTSHTSGIKILGTVSTI
jgi:hypothetical protein